MAWARAGVVLGAVAVAVLALSGKQRDDPRTPVGLPGLPPPLIGVAVVGSGGRTAAVDAYGNVVDLRSTPPGEPLVAVNAKRQAAGSVMEDEALIARARLRDGGMLPLWRADSVHQRYLTGTNVLRTVARFGPERVVVNRFGEPGTIGADRRWVDRARPLAPRAPRWARAMYRRSLLVLRALTDRRSGAVVAGARVGWAYVWPRDAAAAALAYAAAGYVPEARRIVRFLSNLDLSAAARFEGSGAPVPNRAAQGDAVGWVDVAARAVGLPPPDTNFGWRELADYQEGGPGDYLGNAIASGTSTTGLRAFFESRQGLNRTAENAASGLDSTAAWAVQPFPRSALFPAVRRTLLKLVAFRKSRFGIVPSQNWHGGEDPWTAPTAWTAWSLAALGERRAALLLIGDLRRASTPLGLLPERVDAETGLPTSTTPLAWSHAFAILAIRALWPGRAVT